MEATKPARSPTTPAAQGGNAPGAVNARPYQLGTQFLGLQHILGRFSGIHHMQAGHEPSALQGLHHAFRIKRGYAGIRNNRNLAVQSGAVGKLTHAVQRAVFHVDIVGTFPESKRNGRHGASMRHSGRKLKRKVRMRQRRCNPPLMRPCLRRQRGKGFQNNL